MAAASDSRLIHRNTARFCNGSGMALLSAGAPWGGSSFAALLPAALCLSLTTVIRVSRQQRASLLHKNEAVRTRVEAMIGRLKTLEHGA